MGNFVQYQTFSKRIESDSKGIARELKIKLLVKLFCRSLQKDELAENDKPRSTDL